MNRGIFRKTARDTLPLLLIITIAIVTLESLVVGVLSEFTEEINYIWLQRPLFQRFAKMLVGADLGPEASATTFMTIGFTHPLMFTLTWLFLLVTCTRVIAGEIDRGTADLLLTLPVSRGSVYVSVSAVWVLSGIPISLAPLSGAWIGEHVFSLWEPLVLSRLAILIVNLLALYLAIGGAVMLASSVVSRRGPAVAVVLAGLLASFLLNFLAQLWSPAEHVAFLSILHYYKPLPVVRTGDWPLLNITVLLGLGAVFWSVGLWRFTRRDIPAV